MWKLILKYFLRYTSNKRGGLMGDEKTNTSGAGNAMKANFRRLGFKIILIAIIVAIIVLVLVGSVYILQKKDFENANATQSTYNSVTTSGGQTVYVQEKVAVAESLDLLSFLSP